MELIEILIWFFESYIFLGSLVICLGISIHGFLNFVYHGDSMDSEKIWKYDRRMFLSTGYVIIMWVFYTATFKNFGSDILIITFLSTLSLFACKGGIQSIKNKKMPSKMQLAQNISKKIKSEFIINEFKTGLKIEIISLIIVTGLVGLQSMSEYQWLLESPIEIGLWTTILFLPAYFTYKNLKKDKIRNKVNIIFFSMVFVVIGMVFAMMITESYQESIPSLIITTDSTMFPEIDFSLLGLYAGLLPFQIIFGKYSFRFVVLAAIVGSPSGTTTDNDEYPY